MDAASDRTRAVAPWRLLAIAAVVGCATRLLFAFGYWVDQPLTRDEHEYLSLARSLARGDGFVYDETLTATGAEPFGRAPGYPAFLALVGGGAAPVSSVPAAVQAAQALTGALGVALAGLLAGRLGGRRAAVFAAFGTAVYPPLVWIAGYAFSEALFWPMGLAVALLFDRALDAPHAAGRAALCGALLGAGILVRPALVLFVPLAALFLLWRRRWPVLVVLLAACAAVVGPWTIRNYFHYDRLVFVATEGGVTFWTGNHPLATGDGDMAANPAIKLDNQRLRAAYPDLGEEELEPVYYREALRWIVEHPVDWIVLELRKAFYLIVPAGPSYTLHSPRYLAASVLSYLTVLALGGLGIVRCRRDLGRLQGLWLLVGSSVLVALVFFPQERFRIPIIDPALVILAGAGLATFRQPPRA